MLNMKEALSLASKFVALDGEFSFAQLRDDGVLRVSNGVTGCYIPTRHTGCSANVSFRDLRRIVAKLPDPTFAVLRSTLVIGDSDSVFKLRSVPESRVPALPESPGTGWVTVNAETTRALAALAQVAEAEDGRPTTGVRITSDWVCGATQAHAVLYRTSELAAVAPITVPAGAVQGLSTALEVAVGDSSRNPRLWLRDPATGVTRWTATLTGSYPDSLGDQMIPEYVGATDRVELALDLSAAVKLTSRAALTADGDEAARLTSADGLLTLQGQMSRGHFSGDVKIPKSLPTAVCGLAVTSAAKWLRAIEAAGAGSEVRLLLCSEATIEQQRLPLVVTGGNVEAVLMPHLV